MPLNITGSYPEPSRILLQTDITGQYLYVSTTFFFFFCFLIFFSSCPSRSQDFRKKIKNRRELFRIIVVIAYTARVTPYIADRYKSGV